jgi:hypothetical protein
MEMRCQLNAPAGLPPMKDATVLPEEVACCRCKQCGHGRAEKVLVGKLLSSPGQSLLSYSASREPLVLCA